MKRIVAALGLLLVLALPAGADASAEWSARLAVAREQHFQRAWPAVSTPTAGAEAAILEQLAADHPWDAALLAARLEADRGDDADAAALLAIAAARSGLRDTAIAALTRAAQADRRLLADAVLEVAEQRLAAGAAEVAIATLAYLPRLDRDRRNRGSLIEARAELALGRPLDAAQTLQAAEYDPLKLIGADASARLTAGVLQYDLGVALIRSGSVQRGRALLARLGRSSGDEPALQALRDRANLSLASDFLQAGQGATARAIYERVALEGPYSNRALLGMGWAALGPQGDAQATGLTLDEAGTRSTPKFVLKAMQRRRLIDCENYNRRALAPSELCGRAPRFDQAPVPERAETLAEEAIAVWQELSMRTDRDPAVREAWGALGHAAARAGLRAEAIGHYEAAVVRFETALADNQRAIERLAAGSSEWPMDAIAPGTALPADALIRFETAFGVDAAAPSPARQQLLAEQAETRWLLAATGEDETLTALLVAQQQALADTVSASLAAEQTQLRRWLSAVRAALATLSDPSFVLQPTP